MNESISQEKFHISAENINMSVRTANILNPLVLVVEPDEESRFMLRTLLEIWNYRVLEAKSGEEALALAMETCPDLILMEITLQYLDTLASLRRLRRIAQCGEIPIIFLSGHAQPKLRELALALGADDLFVKPVDYELLRKTINRQSKKNKKGTGEIFGGIYQ